MGCVVRTYRDVGIDDVFVCAERFNVKRLVGMFRRADVVDQGAATSRRVRGVKHLSEQRTRHNNVTALRVARTAHFSVCVCVNTTDGGLGVRVTVTF